MFIAMNRFTIAAGREEEFEEVWRTRERFLDQVDGFKNFKLLRGSPGETSTLFISHAVWSNKETFTAWTQSDAFKKAHKDARTPKGVLMGHPAFEGFEVVLEEE